MGKINRWLKLIAIVLAICSGGVAFGQSPLSYPSMHHYRYATDAVYRQLTDALEETIYRNTLNGTIATPRSVKTIPVVVHVMHLEEDSIPEYGTSNPTNLQIRRAIKWINDAFRDTNNFSMGPIHSNAVEYAKNNDGTPVSLDVDTYIQFALAKSNPDSFPTTGIIRYASPYADYEVDGKCIDENGFLQDEEYCLKADSWDSKKYFNIWLVNSICQLDGENCSLEGFSYGGSMSGMPLDGMVLETQFFDTTGRKVTKAVHNIGHYLGLFDTYLNGCDLGSDTVNSCLQLGDKICDTPPDNFSDAGSCSPVSRVNSCSNDALLDGSKYDTDVEDLFENFMDGGKPLCKNSFTVGQQARMIQTITSSRRGLENSSGLQNFITDLGIEKVNHPGPILCGTRVSPVVILKNYGTRYIQSCRIKFILNEQILADELWLGSLAPGQEVSIPFPPTGNLGLAVYNYEFRILEINGKIGDQNNVNNRSRGAFVTVNPQVSINSFPYCVDFDSGIPPIWANANLDGLVNFELFNNLTTCTEEHGLGYLMYNSSGLWNNGQGIGASPVGTRDFFVSPLLDFTSENRAVLTFDFAHKLLDPNKALTLKVWAVRDCDAQPVKVFELSGQELETSSTEPNPNLIGWAPENCDEWRQFKINLDTFATTPFRIFFEAELNGSYTQNFYLDNICFQAKEICDIPDQVIDKAGVYVPTSFCTDSLGWTHYFKSEVSSTGERKQYLLFSTKPASADGQVFIPPHETQLIISPQRASGGHQMTGKAPYAENIKGWNVMSRYLKISDSGQPEDSFVVRFYYDETDFEDMQEAISPSIMEGHDKLTFFTISSDIEVDPSTGHREVTESDFVEYRHTSLPSERSWEGQKHPDGYYYAEFVVEHAYAIGGGSGGFGEGYGARYPVGPKSFDAFQTGGLISINWVTKREYLTSSFEVYYSRDSINFQLLSQEPIPAKSFGTNNPYGTNQDNLEYGPYYYYVKVLHADGLELITDTLKVYYDPRQWINVYPNPNDGIIYVKVNTEIGTDVSFAIFDGAGYRKLLSYDWQQQSDDAVRLDVSTLPEGIFFYVIRFGGREYRDKIIRIK
ncbi:MAG: M43 family zinc metalloprotease [Bacteroidia bacterium]|nr:M43 family zinc metalloprotease [Bacteroidia bacterium]